jgi:hypothetical protein
MVLVSEKAFRKDRLFLFRVVEMFLLSTYQEWAYVGLI